MVNGTEDAHFSPTFGEDQVRPGYSLLDALFMNTSASPFFWPNYFPTFKAEKGVTLHAPLPQLFQAYLTVQHPRFRFPTTTDTKPKPYMPLSEPPISIGCGLHSHN